VIIIKSNLKILFCGSFKSPFILQDYELLNEHYILKTVNLDAVQTKKGYILYMWLITLKSIINIFKYDVIYIWFVDYPTFSLLVLAKLFRKKSVIIVGGWEVVGYPHIGYGNQLFLVRGAITRWCLRNANAVLTPSHTYKVITQSLEPCANIYVIPNAIDKSLCEHPLPDKSDKIVTALYKLKGGGMLKGIPTFEEVKKQIPYECIMYEGIPHNILMDKLRDVKVYCQLSYTESFGVTNLEAMACGCVPVVTDRGALPEVVGNTGVIVPYGDVDATIKAIYIALTMDGSFARERAKSFIKEERLKMLSDILEDNYLPLVSIVIPSYNSAQWLPDTIKSILDQTYKNIEIIVVDDCSTDNTYEVVSKFNTVKYIKNSVNLGECVSSRRGFDESTGDYICRLSADDMYANVDKIKHQVEIMEQTRSGWSYNSINCVGELLETSKHVHSFLIPIPLKYCHKSFQLFDNCILKFPYFSFIRLFFNNPVNSSTLMFRRSSYMNSVKWSNGRRRTDCDGLLIFNLFLKRYKCIAIHEMGSFYRIHPDQMSYNQIYINDMRDNKLEVIQKVLDGNYPLWLKCTVKIIRKFI
jgi:glycosyltransferase involved in cell wall biosynthesis